MSKLLMDESPLQVLPGLANLLGINGAIILQQLHWLLQDDRNGVIMDNMRWIYNTYDQWQKTYFTWISSSAIKAIFLKLEKDGYVISVQPKKNNYDRRKYYTINYSKFEEADKQTKAKNDVRSDKICTIEGTKTVRSNGQNLSILYNTKTTAKTTAKKKGIFLKKESELFKKLVEKYPDGKLIECEEVEHNLRRCIDHYQIGMHGCLRAAEAYMGELGKWHREEKQNTLVWLFGNVSRVLEWMQKEPVKEFDWDDMSTWKKTELKF